MQRADMAGLI